MATQQGAYDPMQKYIDLLLGDQAQQETRNNEYGFLDRVGSALQQAAGAYNSYPPPVYGLPQMQGVSEAFLQNQLQMQNQSIDARRQYFDRQRQAQQAQQILGGLSKNAPEYSREYLSALSQLAQMNPELLPAVVSEYRPQSPMEALDAQLKRAQIENEMAEAQNAPYIAMMELAQKQAELEKLQAESQKVAKEAQKRPIIEQGGVSYYEDTGEPVIKGAKPEPLSPEGKVQRDIEAGILPKEALDAQRNEKLTVEERRAYGFAQRAAQAEKMLSELLPSAQKAKTGAAGWAEAILGSIPSMGIGDALGSGIVNLSASPEQQKYMNAATEFIRAKLRKESGAVIGADEMRKEYETYFPVPGNSKEVIAQKEQLRKTVLETLAKEAGRAWRPEQQIERPNRQKAVSLSYVKDVAARRGISEQQATDQLRAAGYVVR